MIVRNTQTLQKYISVNASLEYDTLKPYISQAERKHVKELIGAEQYAIFDEEDVLETGIVQVQLVDSGSQNAAVVAAHDLAQEAICNFAMYYALPIINSQITQAGVFNLVNQDVSTASDKSFKELQRSFKTAAHEALDEMFKVMESNLSDFTAWTENDVYKEHQSLLVNSTEIFNKHYNIFNSRQTFLALKAEIKIVEFQYIKAVIGAELLKEIKNPQTNENRKEAKELLQQSIVCFTIAKIMQNGLFILGALGMHVRFDVLPYEMVKGITNENAKESQKNKISEAEQFLKLALQVVTDNAIDFDEYTAPEETSVNAQPIIKTKGITML
jgi:hypothetical protein